MKLVHTTQDRITANIIKAELENNNIETVIMDKKDSAINSFGFLEIYVTDPEFELAKKVVHETLEEHAEE
ncbi:DUF2007 domain-containing protein [Membranicola marinus]|uniref:DUF2007 domain-containing protein n=1 Tax=Membranihabitans marinus TaxID=1227546 RepID=A0A953HMP7_9BACT|nr:DUF2007 domain-containing protein [Membranihabitans marinus]MBY5958462.1 DUF2007 domain-containing protein [Membranihabitans marinus]